MIRYVPDVRTLPYNASIYGDNAGVGSATFGERFTQWCVWADSNGLSRIEYLVPQFIVQTEVRPFRAEARFVREGRTPPTEGDIQRLGPWEYYVAFDGVSTRESKDDLDWRYHRYRASLLVDTAAEIAGDKLSTLSVMDVACHCGLFSIEFAEAGFGSVTGFDLRDSNIAQARFLAQQFATNNTSFYVANARDVAQLGKADVVFCAGLLYHVTFPMDLLAALYAATSELLILDSVCLRHPFSGFELVRHKDVCRTVEGETEYELTPTYRGVVDALRAVGFDSLYEVLGDGATDVPWYRDASVRSLIAAKRSGRVLTDFMRRSGFDAAAGQSAS
jgi:Methyltransferase domain